MEVWGDVAPPREKEPAVVQPAKYLLVMQHTTDGRSVAKTTKKYFATYEEAVAVAEATSPEKDGSMLPNVAEDLIAKTEGRDWEYSRGFWWWNTNRYAVLFGRPEGWKPR